MKHPKRRFFSVTSSLQYRFLATILTYSFVLVCFFALAVFVPDILEMVDENLRLEIRGTAASRFLGKSYWVWPAVALLILFLCIHFFRIFQRITGPLYRFRRAFEEMQNGEIRFPLRTRAKDYLVDEEEAFNKMLKVLLERIEGMKDVVDGTLRSMDDVEQGMKKGADTETPPGNLIRIHRDHLERLVREIGFFRVEHRDAQSKAEPAKRL